jgi:RNA-binding protein Musashi
MYLPTTSTYYCTYGDRTYGNRTHGDEGFGFVVFKSTDYVEEVLKLQYHEIDGKKVEVKRAEPRSATASAMRHTHPSLQFPYPPAYGTPGLLLVISQ